MTNHISANRICEIPAGSTVEHRLKSPRPVATSVLVPPVRRRPHRAWPEEAYHSPAESEYIL